MKREPKRFDMLKKPTNTRLWARLIMWTIAPFWCWFSKARVKTQKEVRKIKGPYLILSTHQSYIDFPMLLTAIYPRMTNWVIAIDEFRHGGEWVMRGIGGIPKRKFQHDICTVKFMLESIKKKKRMITFYPEARFELAGVNERLDKALGKLCKQAKVPVCVFKANGNFIDSPQWSKHPYRRVRKEGHLFMIANQQEVETLSADVLQERIEKAFVKDDYKWVVENNVHTKCKQRADGLYRILYKCPHCGKEFEMESAGIHLWCNACGSKWEMDTLFRLHGLNTDKGFTIVSDWYRWEREEVRKEVRSGNYKFTDQVRIEDFHSIKLGCIDVGNGTLVQDKNGFTVTGTVEGKPFVFEKPLSTMYSVHVEYNFLGRGDAIDLANTDRTYFMYPLTAKNNMTKVHFAQEELYDYYVVEKADK